ncbi:hypothetical protein BVRB_1g010080 [Beta vulgaris subsp. vulgaris]|nr:hypothetical protein BVRB_1g010080 [Beta vulgaris subsp. vulgaris]
MAGRSKAKAKKSGGKNSNKEKKKGSVSPITGQKHKSMAELHGIEDLVIQTPEFEKPLSPVSSLKELQNQSREKATLSEWLTIMKKTQGRLEAINGAVE